MSPQHRSPQDCRFRNSHNDTLAQCDLLRQITKVQDLNRTCVPNGACEACCRSHVPSATDPNPIVASLLYQLSDTIVAAGGVTGCDQSQAERLRDFAATCIPKTAPHEPDSSAVVLPDYSQPGSQMSLNELLPAPKAEVPIKHWSVGITTAPRRLPTIDDCLDSVINAGWQSVRIFSDGDVPLADRHAEIPITRREPQIGAWPNFYLSLAEQLMREPEADAYLMIQDDALFFNHRGLRDYLEGMMWTAEGAQVASLFCPQKYTQPTNGWCQFEGSWVWGAQAFVFSRPAAQSFLADKEVVRHRWNAEYQGLCGIDVLIGKWAQRSEIPIYFPTPSLVQHIGHVSAIWERDYIIGPRRADRFAGDIENT